MSTVGELATVTTGSTPLRSNPEFYSGGSIPWITSGDLNQGIIRTAKQFVTERALADTSLKMVSAGAILVAMYGEGKTRGTAALLDIDATTNQACATIQLRDPSLRPWVKVVLDANYNAMRRMAAGGVQPNLNLSLVRSIEIPLPPSNVRQATLQQLEVAASSSRLLLGALDDAGRRLDALRRSILTSAFSGRLSTASTVPV